MGGKITMQARKRKILYPAQWLIPPRSSHQHNYILFAFSQHLGEVTPAGGVHVFSVVPEVTLETMMSKVSSWFPWPRTS